MKFFFAFYVFHSSSLIYKKNFNYKSKFKKYSYKSYYGNSYKNGIVKIEDYRRKYVTFLPSITENSFLKYKMIQLEDFDYKFLNFLESKLFKTYKKYPCSDLPQTNYENKELIQKGLFVAYLSHLGQFRKSGKQFITHPVSVAMILSQSGADCHSIIAGLLHDTVEDTELTFDDIEKLFNDDIRKIVEGETKVSKIPKLTRRKKVPNRSCIEKTKLEQNENLRSMFISMADDWRIIVVKLADRLHNMRTLKYMSNEKQIEISKETLNLFVPLAHRLGLWKYKIELEDLSFKFINPAAYYAIERDVKKLKFRRFSSLNQIKTNLTSMLNRISLNNFRIESRTKSIYSIWKKINTKNCDITGILDTLALRIIIEPNNHQSNFLNDEISVCYQILGNINNVFTPIPGTLKDYISSPKPNGYRSLHTTILFDSQPVEIQIRTQSMHHIAEWGTAAHWTYKGSESSLSWLQIVRTWDSQVNCSMIFMDRVRTELLGSRVFVFGPNGQILNLAKGANLNDAVQKLCQHKKEAIRNVSVNGKYLPMHHILKNGDIISINNMVLNQ